MLPVQDDIGTDADFDTDIAEERYAAKSHTSYAPHGLEAHLGIFTAGRSLDMRDVESLDYVGEDQYDTHQDGHREDHLLDLYIL